MAQFPTFASRPLTSSFTHPVDIPQNCVVGQERQQMSELQFDKFHNPSSFLVWKTRFKTQVSNGSDFQSNAVLWIEEVEMADSLDELKSWRSENGKDFPNFEMLDAKLWTRSSRILSSKRRSASRRKPKKRTGFCEEDKSPSWSTTTFEWLVLMTQYWIMLIHSLLLFMMMTKFRNSMREGTKFYYRWQKFHPMKSWNVCTNWGYNKPDQFKTVLELYDIDLMRGLLQHWTKSTKILTSKEESVWRNQSPKRGPFPSWQTDCLLDLRLLPGHWNPWFCRKLCRPIHYQSTKWWYSGIWFKVGRKFVVHDENPTWWYLGRIVQIKNTRVWETQKRIGIVRHGDSSEDIGS